MKIAIFYASSTCYTFFAAEKIAHEFNNHQVDMFDIKDNFFKEIHLYDLVICGIPTWDYGQLQEDFKDNWQLFDELDFSGVNCALYGMGDQVGYPDYFVDALGDLYIKLASLNANLIGTWPNHGYNFNSSKALLSNNMFAGLVLDEDNQYQLSQNRISKWASNLLNEIKAN